MKRQPFIESLGASCANWRWSWSFVNETKRWVIFGAWDVRETPEGQVILADDWEVRSGRRTPAYKESLKHVRLVEAGFALFTFRMERELAYPGSGKETSKIKAFDPVIVQKHLLRVKDTWVAVDHFSNQLPEQITLSVEAGFPEGGRKRIEINAYERSSAARAICLATHGFCCFGCGLRMSDQYGDIAKNFIHVHHLKPVAKLESGYSVNPVNDLVPLCPNCHAVIHLSDPMLTISKLRELLGNLGKTSPK